MSDSIHTTICDKPLARAIVELSSLALPVTGALAYKLPDYGMVKGAGLFPLIFLVTFSAFWVGLILYRACVLREQEENTDILHH